MSEKSRKLKVEGLPRDAAESQLSVLLSNKRRQGGGPIENIEHEPTKGTAIVTFEESDAVDLILSIGETVQLSDVTVMVSRYFYPDDTQSSMKRSRARSKGNILAVVDESDDLSDREDSIEKVNMKSKKSLTETDKNKKTAGVKKQHALPDEEGKPLRKMSKTYSQASDDEHINSSDDNESLPRELKNKYQKPVKDKAKNKSSMLPKAFPPAKQNVEQKPKVSKYSMSQDELSDTESQSKKPNNRKHKSMKEISSKKTSSVGKKTTSDSDGDSKFYRKRSKAYPRNIRDDESSNDSTESESSSEKSERKIDCSHKTSPNKAKSSMVNKVTFYSENSEEEHIEEPEAPWRLTIKARVADITKTKDFYVMYFEDPHISKGEFYEESFLLDGLNRNLYVTFCDRKAAVATVSFKHKAESYLLKVDMANEEDFDTYPNLISVHGCDLSTADLKGELKKTIEKVSQMEVINIMQQDEPRSAIIVFNPDSCEDISAITWKSVCFGTTRLIVAPVFKTNSIKVTGLHHMSSDDTVKRYLSNTKRSGGDEITFFQRLSKTEAWLTFKDKKSVDGVTRNFLQLDGAELHVIEYHPCLTTEVYKKQVEPLMEQFMNNTEVLAGLHSASSRQINHREDPVATRPLQMLQSRLNCKKVSLYTFNDRSSKKIIFKLCKFGYEFLKRQDVALTQIMDSVHCNHILDPDDMTCSVFLSLNWLHRMRYFAVIQMIDDGLDKVKNFLDTFTVAQFEVPQIYEFQQYYIEICQEKSLGFDIFFDKLDNLAGVVISKQDEHVMEDSMNTLYQEFMTSILYPTVSDHNRPHINVCQSGESRLCQNENSLQHTRTGMDCKFENLGYDGKRALQSVPNSNDRNQSKKKNPEILPKARKEKNTIERQVEDGAVTVHLTMEQELELDEKDIIMLEKTHFHQDLEKENMPLQIILNTEKTCAIIRSNDKHNIDHAQVELLKKIRDFTNIDITSSFSAEQLQLLSKEEVQNKINNTYIEMNCCAHFRCSSGTVSIYHVKDVNSTDLKDVAISQVTTRKKPLDEKMVLILQSEKGRKFLAEICEIHDGVKVSSCVKLENSCLHIVSPSKQLDIVVKTVNRFLEENKSYEKVIPFSRGKQKFVHKCLSQDLKQISDSLIPLGAKIVDHAEKYTVQGLKDGVTVGEKKLFQLSKQILVQEVTMKYFGIKEFLQTADGESLLTRAENAQPCVILQSDLPSRQVNAATYKALGLKDDGLPKVMTVVSDQTNLKIYADSHKNIAFANIALNDLVKAAFREERDKNERLKKLDKYQVQKLKDEGKKYHVKVTFSIEQCLITMSSFDKDGIFNVHKLLMTQLIAALEDHHTSLLGAVTSAINWQFEQEKWRDFEPLLNSELEREYKKKSKQHNITDAKGHTYLIDFSAMKAFRLNSSGQPEGHGLIIRRYDRTREGEPLPKGWEHMKDSENLKLVTLQAGSPEFKAAEQRFIQGGANVPIKKIQRLQNKSCYQQFKAKKREMDHRNPKGHENERRLFHGTDERSMTAINENGFNRSYCGKNATPYGNGVYFAVQSSYSLGYAKQSSQGERFMYIARVLTGESTLSSSGMSYLPNKPGTNIPYDSGTGTASNIFIIFNDTQAYPEYVIIF